MIISNEKEYALNCLENGIVDKNPYQVISILAKYYWHNGLKKKQIIDNLLDYLKKYYPRYELNEEQWLSEIEKVTEQAYRKKLFEISGVKITKPEINRIKSIKNKTLEKLAFTSLCIAKLNNLKSSNNNGWVNTDTGDIFKMAHISCSVFEQDVKLNKLYVLGMVDFPKANGNLNYRVTMSNIDSILPCSLNNFAREVLSSQSFCFSLRISCFSARISAKYVSSEEFLNIPDSKNLFAC